MIVQNLSYECDNLRGWHGGCWQLKNSFETAESEIDTICLICVNISVEQWNDEHQH